MRNSVTRKIFFFFWMLIASLSSYAQQVKMEVNQEAVASKPNLMDLVLTLVNSSEQPFNGSLRIKTPEGFRSISGDWIDVHIDAADRVFIPVKILFQQIAKAGTSNVQIELLDYKQKVLQTERIGQLIEENNTMRLSTDNPMVFINNPNDSLSLQVTVSNLGNQKQNTSVVFSIPGLMGEKNFFEKKATIDIQKDSVLVFTFLPPQSLIDQPQFTVNVAGMRGVEKALFGNLSITIQNVSSTKRYQDIESTRQFHHYRRNSLTTSYRNVGNNGNTYQVTGSGDINLSAGYLSLNGNAYKSDYNADPIISNTYLGYYLDNHEIKIGNINQSLEMSLYGRGIEIATTDKTKSKKIQIGFIDQNFNLIEKHSFMQNGYGLYAIGSLNKSNSMNQTMVNYIFKEDEIERAQHHMVGIERSHTFNKDWRANLKLNTAMSHYERVSKDEPSFALETQYNGEINRMKLSGNYFYSTDYFPGNRRGMLQFQQSAIREISKNKTLYANIFMADFSPKSHTYSMNLESKNLRLDSGITFSHIKNIFLRFGYQYQTESSNSFAINKEKRDNLGIKTHRLVENINWLSKNNKHSISLTLEEGLYKISDKKDLQMQFKTNATYSFKWLTANVVYQYGSFYLSEYINTSRATNQSQVFQRIMSSVSIDKNFLKNKLNVSSGATYINDFTIGQTPSAFLNIRYAPKEQYQVYLNSSWYRYDYQHIQSNIKTTSNMFIIEAGLTFNFNGRTPSSGRKATLTAQVYYDKNTNNLFDEGDEKASDYLITIDKTTFKTDNEGKLKYRSLPFGSYKLKPSSQNGWFTTGGEYEVTNYKNSIAIPLHQSGTAAGKIKYDYDIYKILDFEPKMNGIVFNIYQNEKFLQRISTNDEGEFILFLPTGDYQISLNANSLPKNAFCEEKAQSFTIKAGVITNIPKFVIKVQEKKINIKKFGS